MPEEPTNGTIGLQYLIGRIDEAKDKIKNGQGVKTCLSHGDISDGLVTLLEVEKYHLQRSKKGAFINRRLLSIVATVFLGLLLGCGWWVKSEIRDVQLIIQPTIEQVQDFQQ